MSGRIEKPRSRKSNERDALRSFIALHGQDAEMPCTYCFDHQLKCRLADVSRLLAQQKKLDDAEEKAKERLVKLQVQLS
ncbi:hypothetical protein LEL_06335 [Akanthomyces lecanii RCEF 1005]|uniref:Uncharacterized protein n=1 Tax=Akanthomyces lecanii RCEF 1005 TaxID=1081108 RepID=A0A168GLS6_CORDF|nr:hypothetical protein LEL_06335 [Akanthomyces lecanii RCEF 1005]